MKLVLLLVSVTSLLAASLSCARRACLRGWQLPAHGCYSIMAGAARRPFGVTTLAAPTGNGCLQHQSYPSCS